MDNLHQKQTLGSTDVWRKAPGFRYGECQKYTCDVVNNIYIYNNINIKAHGWRNMMHNNELIIILKFAIPCWCEMLENPDVFADLCNKYHPTVDG